MSGPKLLAETAHYRATFEASSEPTRVTVIWFDHYRPEQAPLSEHKLQSGETLAWATRSQMNGIHIQARRNDWFQAVDVRAILDAVRQTKQPGDTFIAYGGSMGGYASIAYCEALGADGFVALAPQASLSADYMRRISDNRWPEYWRAFHNNSIERGHCADATGLVFYDPLHASDNRHAQTILDNTKALAVECCATAHQPGEMINRTYKIVSAIRDLGNRIADNLPLEPLRDDIQNAIRSDFMYRYYMATDSERRDLRSSISPDAFREMIYFPALIDDFRRQPGFCRAMVLSEFSTSDPERWETSAALDDNGFSEMATRIRPLLAG